MIIKKTFFSLFAISLLSLYMATSMKADPTNQDSSASTRTLNINLQNNQIVNVNIYDGLTITTSGDYLIIDDINAPLSFEIQNVRSFNYGKSNSSNNSFVAPVIDTIGNNLYISQAGSHTYFIHDMQGHLLHSDIITDSGIISTDNLPTGVYVISLENLSLKFYKK